jgi:RHS repeat-associated protein
MTRPVLCLSAARRCFSLLLIFVLGFTALCKAQNSGPLPFDSFQEEINLGSLQPSIAIPIFKKAVRGGRSIEFTLRYNGVQWIVPPPSCTTCTTSWTPDNFFGWVVDGFALAGGIRGATESPYPCGPNNQHIQKWVGWQFFDASGAAYSNSQKTLTTYGPNTCGKPTSDSTTANDGSGYFINVGSPNSFAISPQGVMTAGISTGGFGGATVTDRNGNEVAYNLTSNANGQTYTVTDTTGATVLTVFSNWVGINGLDTPTSSTYTWTSASAAQVTATLNFAPYTLQTNFQCGYSEEQRAAFLPSSLVLPNGAQYTFGYEQTPGYPSGNTTARLASITLPTGGVILYDFSGAPNDDMDCSQVSPFSNVETHMPSLKRTTLDGPWTYTNTFTAGTFPQPNQYKTDVIDPQGNKASHYFVQNGRALYKTETLTYSGTSTLLRTANTCYNGNPSPCTSASNTTDVTTPITQIATQTVLPSGQVSQTVELRDPLGFLTQEFDEYDFGAGSTGSLLRKTLTTYGSFNGTGCTALGNHLTGFPCTKTVLDGTGATIAQTRYTYDEGSVVAPPSGTSPQHVSVSGSRGNATTISSLVGGTTYLTKTFAYYDTGLVRTATDSNGTVTTYYPDATSTCGNAFPTSVSLPLGLSTSSTWDCNGGVITSSTDPNGRPTRYGYGADPFWRVLSVTDPLNNTTSTTYSAGGSIPPTVETVLSLNSTSSVDELTTFDGRWRPYLKQRRQAPSSTNFDTVVTGYDSIGRAASVGVPCVSTASKPCTSAATTTTYDTLGRRLQVIDGGGGSVGYSYAPAGTFNTDLLTTVGPAPSGENAKKKQIEYDGLGRVSSVCELTGTANGGVTCAQNAAQTGYWTRYKYDARGLLIGVCQNTTQPLSIDCTRTPSAAQQTRTYAYDGLGRLTSETNPESGTTAYTYDSDSGGACSGTYKGDLVKRVDNAGNVTCHTYDALHRQLSATYVSGPNAAVTPNKCFVYDATIDGQTVTFTGGRLAEAYTTTASCSTTTLPAHVTDEAFGYSARGEITDVYESTPNSGAYYHTTASYWANGALNVLGGVPSKNAWTYGVDAEGRMATVISGTTVNLVTGTSYNPARQVTNVVLGSADSDAYTYDSNTGRMTQYQFNIGSPVQSVTGKPTWNQNGTLGTLTITDPFNSANAQTCTYGYDDLARQNRVSCGTTWSQTFGYDSFGNISKSGSISFQASYSPSTNRITMLASTVPTYDANGNLLTIMANGSHTFTWDAAGKILGMDTVSLTYDALGRMVEQSRSGATTEILYGPTGKLALMNGQSVTKAFVPLPGGDTAVVKSGNSPDHYRHADWLGSSRFASTPGRTMYYDVAYAPFGENYSGSGTADPNFTGQNQDTVSGFYDFLYREYHPTEGRWISPDPAGKAAADPSNPQSWNRYAYVGNHPLASTDPLGLCAALINPRCPTYTVDGFTVPDRIGRGVLTSGAGGQCPSNDCTGVKLLNNSGSGEFYRTSYDKNPDIFLYTPTDFYPTHWVSTYLGNGLPSSVRCVYIGGVCDFPVPASSDFLRDSKYCRNCDKVIRGADQVGQGAFWATGAVVAAPFVGVAGVAVGAKEVVALTLMGSVLAEFINNSFDVAAPPLNPHIPDEGPPGEEGPGESRPGYGPEPDPEVP